MLPLAVGVLASAFALEHFLAPRGPVAHPVRDGAPGRGTFQEPAPASIAVADGASAERTSTAEAAGNERPADLGSSAGMPLESVRDEIVAHTDASLGGAMYIDDALDYMLEFASLPICEKPELEFEDDDAIAYRLMGAPAGTEARMLVGLQPYDSEVGRCRYIQMDVRVPGREHELVEGTVRYSPRIDLSISYREDDPLEPTRFAINVTRPTALSASRRAGIDAYSGRITEGAYYWIDLTESPAKPIHGTYGLVDGQYRSVQDFGGVSPLAGDVDLDTEKVRALLAQLQKHLDTVRAD